jgi:ABC-2 type transport system permease protein
MTTRSHTARFAGALIATNLKAALMLRGAFAMQVAFMALNNAVFFVFWWLLMRRVPVIRGWSLPDVELLFGIVAASFGLSVAVAGGVRHLGRLIEEGELDAVLVQPPPVLLHAWGLRSQASGFGDFLSGVAFLAWSGRVTWTDAPRVGLVMLASALVFTASGTLFFSLPFWLGKVETLSRQLWEVTVTFALYPEPLFGGALRVLLFTIIPAGWVGYVPARAVHQASAWLLLLLTGAAAAYLALAAYVFDRGVQRYASGSRFATFG